MEMYDPLDRDRDPFRPPTINTVVACLHCHQEYDSYRIEWRIEHDTEGRPHGFWCCPTADCGGRGFGFDIHPVDPNYQDERGGWFYDDGDEEDGSEGEVEKRANGEQTPRDDDEALPW